MNKKVLIVDDEAHIRFLIEQALEDLEDEGVELLFTDNGVDALKLMRTESPDLAFLDVMMPGMSGFEVCKTVKGTAKEEAPYIVILTAKGQEGDWQEGEKVGADQYITKPFDPDMLLETAQEILHL